MPRAEAESSSEAYDVDDDVADTGLGFGALKATLAWDGSQKHLVLAFGEHVETTRKLEFRCRGEVNTTTGRQWVCGHLRKNFYTHKPTLQRLLESKAARASGRRGDVEQIDEGAWVPGGLGTLLFKDWSISPGISFDSRSGLPGGPPRPGAGFQYSLQLRKNPQVIKQNENSDVWLAAKTNLLLDPKANEVVGTGSVRLKLFKYHVTSTQDVRLAVGLDVEGGPAGRPLRTSPYLKVGENHVYLKVAKGQATLHYRLN